MLPHCARGCVLRRRVRVLLPHCARGCVLRRRVHVLLPHCARGCVLRRRVHVLLPHCARGYVLRRRVRVLLPHCARGYDPLHDYGSIVEHLRIPTLRRAACLARAVLRLAYRQRVSRKDYLEVSILWGNQVQFANRPSGFHQPGRLFLRVWNIFRLQLGLVSRSSSALPARP